MARLFRRRFPKGSYPGQRADGFPMSDVHRQNLDFIKDKVLNKRMDACFCYSGRVGSGKSTKVMQDAMYLDPTFNLDRVVFTPEQTDLALKNATKGQCVVIDEAIIFSSRSAMSEYNKRIVKVMSQIRSKSLFIFFVIPFVWDLDRNLALGRTDMLVNLYSDKYGDRGKYAVYFRDRIKNLYLTGRKFYSFAHTQPNYRATTSSCFVLNEKSYEAKKQKAIDDILTKAEVQGGKYKVQRNELIVFLREKYKLQYKEIAEASKTLTPNAIGKILRTLKKDGDENEL